MSPAVLAWLDYSEADQRRDREIIAMFSQRDSRDEMALGRIRDTLIDAPRSGGDLKGLIGRYAAATIQNLPSTIY